MAASLSTIATAQTLALNKGPNAGSPAPTSAAKLYVLDDKASLAVGTFASTEYARFGIVPAGAKIIPSLSLLSTDHTATIAGSLILVPVDGSASQGVTGTVTANLEATETTSITDANDSVVVAKDSFIQFVPTSNTTIATTAKNLWLRLTYARTY